MTGQVFCIFKAVGESMGVHDKKQNIRLAPTMRKMLRQFFDGAKRAPVRNGRPIGCNTQPERDGRRAARNPASMFSELLRTYQGSLRL